MNLPWRDYLTPEELAQLARADEAKVRWQELNGARAMIVNRAIQRAKYARSHQRKDPAHD